MTHTSPADSSLPATTGEAPVTLQRDEHSISRRQISQAALNVLYDLNKAGFEAYLVGGCIRDLLLGGTPKDFDVATDATPEQVKALFRRSRIVGRRFQIVHVRMGREVIEVTTFRGQHSEDNATSQQSQANEHGMLLRDNVYGSLRDDALRRDFTVNALYYTVDGFRVLDYCDGLKDLARRELRMIGDPATRYREDPVRMLRAVRFSAKLDFALATETAEPIRELAPLLGSVSAARLFDELIKLFQSGYGAAALGLASDYQLLEPLLGEAARELGDPASSHYQLVAAALQNTDKRIANEQSVTPAFLFASLLWQQYCDNCAALEADDTPPWRAAQIAGHMSIDQLQSRLAVPRRYSIAVRDIWYLQRNLASASGKRAVKLLGHSRFRAAYDFLLMREKAGEALERGSQYWTDLQQEHADKVNHNKPSRPGRRRGRRRKPDRQQ